MTSTIKMNTNTSNDSRKKTLLKFLLGKPEEQSTLFRQIINSELVKRKEFMEDLDPQFAQYNAELNDSIYNSKLKEIERQTKILKDQMKAHANNEKYPSIVSIIERKLYIVEMQIDIGIHNLLQNNNVKFYFEV
jgi:hypothetical protein